MFKISPKWRRKRVWMPLLVLLALAAFSARPLWLIGHAALTDRDERRPEAAGIVDDASRLNATRMAEVWDLPADEAAAEAGLRQILVEAARRKRPVSIAGARHSMGGQTIAPDGVQINMLTHARMSLAAPRVLHVQTGALWSQVIAFLEPLGLSPLIMQSNCDFSVGGSLSVNCHGWQFDQPPIAASVRSFHIMLADGTVRNCSRSENEELFQAALGGYGLFGVLLDADLQVTDNEHYLVEQYAQPTADFPTAWNTHLQPLGEIGMGLGRLSIDADHFLDRSLLYVMRRSPAAKDEPPTLALPAGYGIARPVFLASIDSDAGKALRWAAESSLLTHFTQRSFWRNQLLNQPVEFFENRTEATTDLLQEYFVPPARLLDFVQALREIVPRNHANLLNLTIRDVRRGDDGILRFATQDVMSLVLLYHVSRTNPPDLAYVRLTQESVEAALRCGGGYYLPYRLDATAEQFRRAYPLADKFFALKRKYDPDERFQNAFYQKYGRP
ncbi:MAG TPA: FAD-binding oxidoreductase [Pirellulales bacterium]|jgi:FAD/FMN-containing dehydrogenase|nr:FAD-binding oxidoreductase [Pirellulales bacterium]